MGWAQPLPCPPVLNSFVSAGPDTTICPGVCATLSATMNTSLKSTSSYQADTIPYAHEAYNQGTAVIVNQDDIWSQVITMPFQFCFFGNKYNQIVIGSNGNISFNIALANTFNAFTVNQPIPSNYSSYNNCIMAPFFDMDPRAIGNIRYNTFGVAPCRRFVISWDSVATFACAAPGGGGCTFINTQQIVMYETTYAIDVNVQNHNFYNGSTSAGNASLGIQNNTATLGYSFPGKNNAQWNETNKSYRFTPNGAPTTSITWTNLSNGVVVGNTANVTVCPSDTTKYLLKVVFGSQCDSITFYDTVQVNVAKSVVADFTYDIKYGCGQDTVIFTNTSNAASSYQWSFGDGSGTTQTNPTHIYNSQAIFTVQLIAAGNPCKDTVEKDIDLVHPLEASFTIDDDSVCQNTPVNFANTSVTTTRLGIDPTWYWEFGDGATSTQQNPNHTYASPGVYTVMMVVKDFVPCYDTAYGTVVVDSTPYVRYTVSDSVICDGESITFYADYLTIGNIGMHWEFGDGTGFANMDTISHAYDSAGTYTIKIVANYRICDDVEYTRDITVLPFPTIDLGPDTTICLNGEPVVLTAITTPPGLGRIMWNTGDSLVQQILIRHHGTYYANINLDGCIARDTVEVRKDCYTDVPNAFTPNGDGNNDYFYPRQLLSRSVAKFKMQVFNRWGQSIFETTKTDGRGWDGKFNGEDQPTGVYIYLLEATFSNGVSEKYQGNVTLMR